MEDIEQEIPLKERRRAPRTVLRSVFMDLYPLGFKKQRKLRGRILDISPLGIRFVCDKAYVKDSMISLDLLLPNSMSFTKISGKVVRCEEKSSEGYHVAVEFDEDYHQQSLVKEYIRIMKLWDEQFNR